MKSILVFSSMLFISIAAIIQTNNVVVTSSLPNYAKPGEAVDFDIVISKGDLGGFSKLQMIFPEGFEVEATDAKGGTFSFIDQKLKIIWVALPGDPKFSVSFKVNIKSGTEGSFPLAGQFSYIQDGVRTNADYTTRIFVAEDKPTDLVNAEKAKESAAENSETATASTTATKTGAENINAATSFKFTRNISNLKMKPSESATVKLDVRKIGISGFGKITEIIPAGFTAEEIESNGGIFSVLNNEVRFLWMTLPAADSFEVSYKLVANDQEGEYSVKGSFSYVEDTKTRLNSTSATIFKVEKEEILASTATTPKEGSPVESEAPVVASTESTEEASKEEVEKPTTSNTTGNTPEEVTEEVVTASTEDTKETTSGNGDNTTDGSAMANVNSGAKSNRDVSYRVQICATRKAVDKQYFVKNNNVREEIYADMHNGWHKFTVGAFDVYGKARNHREEVKETNKVTGPFVTAYNAGNRITVQEALMISKQEWVP